MPAVFCLQAQPPFRLDLTAWAIRRRAENKIDLWDGARYRRALALHGKAAEISVTQRTAATSRLRVRLAGSDLDVSAGAQVTSALDRLLGRRIDLQPFYRDANQDRRLSYLVHRFHGLKPPRFPSVFEALLNGIACQQLSLAVGITLLNRLSEAYGVRFREADHVQYSFATPELLACARLQDLRKLGFSSNKSRALIGLASAVASGQLDLERLETIDNEEAVYGLLTIREVGRWTAEHVLLRGSGRTTVFPGDDVGAGYVK